MTDPIQNLVQSKERLILTSIIGAQLGPVLARLAVPQADQAMVVGYIVAGIPVAYHLAAVYVPRILARLFPPLPGVPK